MMITLLAGCGSGSGKDIWTPGGSVRPPENGGKESEVDPHGQDGTVFYEGDQIYCYEPDESAIVYDEYDGISYVNNIVIIYLKPSATEADRNELAARIGGEIVGRIDPLGEIQVRINTSDINDIKEICSELMLDDRVDLATYDEAGTAEEDYYPSDPKYMSWAEGDRDNRNWGLIAVEAPGAWGYLSRLSPVDIGVVDNGFLVSHEDLRNSITRVSGSTANERDHGTHVAGIMGAAQDNGTGISGVAPNSYILAYGAQMDATGTHFVHSAIFAGLAATVRAGAKAINFWLGSSGGLTNDSSTRSREEIDAAGREASRNIGVLLAEGHDFVVIQSAGNGASNYIGVDAVYNGIFCAVNWSNCDTQYASANDIIGRIIVVGNAMRSGNGYMMSRSSNGGDRVDICAPGTNIFSCVTGTAHPSGDGYSNADGFYDEAQLDDNDPDGAFYMYKSGTSMAAPFVTGIAGLVWGADPDLTGLEVKEILCSGANANRVVYDNPDSPYTSGTYNLINARLCVEDALSRAGKVQDYSIYADVIRQYESQYGRLEFVDPRENSYDVEYYKGVFLVDYLDFDRDGYDELLIGYAVEQHADFGISWPYLDVWTVRNGSPELAFEGANVGHSDIGTHTEYTYYDGKLYLVTGFGGYDFDLYYMSMENGEFSTEMHLTCSGDDDIWYNNGTEIDDGWTFYQNVEAGHTSFHGVLMDYEGETRENLRVKLDQGRSKAGLD